MNMTRRNLLVMGVILIGLAQFVSTAAIGQDKAEPPKWELKSVTFGSDEAENTKKLNDLNADGWEYVGPITADMVAFKRLREIPGLVSTWEHPAAGVSGVTSIAVSPDGRHVLSASGRTVCVFETATGRIIHTLLHPQARSVAFTPDGKQAVSVGSDGEGTLRVWDLETGTQRSRFAGYPFGLTGAVVSPDGKRVLFSSTHDNAMRLLELETGQEIQRFDATSMVHGVDMSADGKKSLSGSPDKTVRLWDNETGKELLRLEGHKDQVWDVAISPDGKQALSCGKERDVILWDLETGNQLQRLRGDSEECVGAVAFSRDGRFFASGDYGTVFGSDRAGHVSIHLWDAKAGKEVCRLEGHTASVYDLAFSPDGRFLVSGSLDKTVRVWRLPK